MVEVPLRGAGLLMAGELLLNPMFLLVSPPKKLQQIIATNANVRTHYLLRIPHFRTQRLHPLSGLPNLYKEIAQ